MFDTPEEKAALAAAVKTAVTAAVLEATAGLQDKNKELITELRAAKKGQEITPADVEKLETKIETLEGEAIVAKKSIKDLTKSADTATKGLESETAFTRNLLIDNGLTNELTKNGVTNAAHLSGATALLRTDVEIVVDGKKRTAMVGDKPLADHVKEWAGSDTGKNYVAAPGNNGGGANGGKGGLPKGMKLEDMSPAQKMEFGRQSQTGKTVVTADKPATPPAAAE